MSGLNDGPIWLEGVAGHVLEVGDELHAGDEESSAGFQVGVGVGGAELNVGAIERDSGIAIVSGEIVGELHTDGGTAVAGGGSRRGSEGEEGESESDGGLHFDTRCLDWED